MDAKGKEKGILKLEPRQRPDAKLELTPQGSYDRPPSSPQPSVDRLSVTWADPGSMTSSGVNLFHMPPDTPAGNEVKFSPSAGDGSEDEDYSSLSAVLRQRRASVRRSRKGRSRRPSSPFLPDENRPRRRSSVFTTSSGDTAISIDDQPVVTQEQIFENIHLHKEVLGSVKQQPLEMRRKLKIVHQAKGYVKRHEGQLQERLAQSKSTRDIYARFNILLATKWQQIKREAANMSNLLIPWELRIKEIESHFGSVVASYFTFLRWLFWVNLVIGFILLVFVIIPECLTANPLQDGERKVIMDDEYRNATNLLTLWEFEGVLKYSPIFYGYYSNVERDEYRMPLAYFLTGLVVYIYSFVAILRKMAENSRMSKLSEKEDECIFSWKLFTGWDFMIGNAETAHNRIASVILGFKEALLEEAEKKKNLRNWRIISLRAVVNICVVILLAVSAFAVVTVVSRSDDNPKIRSWWRENETTIVVTVITITFPVLFELLGLLEHYHPRKQLRLQLARIMLLNLLNLYSLIFALFSKIEGMSKELVSLQPSLNMNAVISESSLNVTENLIANLPKSCFEITVPCLQCNMLTIPKNIAKSTYDLNESKLTSATVDSPVLSNMESTTQTIYKNHKKPRSLILQVPATKRGKKGISEVDEINLVVSREMEKLRNISKISALYDSSETVEINDTDSDYNYDLFSDANTEITAETNTQTDNDTSTTSFFSTDYTDSLMINDSLINNPLSTDPDNITLSDIDTITWTETTLKDNFYDIDSTPTPLLTTNEITTNTNVDYITEINTKSSPIYESSSSTNAISENNVESSRTSIDMTGYDITTEITSSYKSTENMLSSSSSSSNTSSFSSSSSSNLSNLTNTLEYVTICPNTSLNFSIKCGDKNVTQIINMSNCNVVDMKCYETYCVTLNINSDHNNENKTNLTMIDAVFIDTYHRKMYNLTISTKKKLLKLCWETMFGQELVKLTMMDLVFVLLGTLFMDFFRALFVRYMNRCWCWDLEKKCPEYGDFKIAENILHLINNQGMVWMGMFFSPGLVVLNVVKLMIMMYLRSWAVMTCNVPHEVVFRVSKSNNFYLALLLTMLFLCVLPVGYTIVWVTPSWHCGPFSEYDKIYKILTSNIYKILPTSLNFTLEYIASPAIVIPLLVLLILIIYYLTSLTNSLREANNDLKIQLRRERTEERRKMFQLADTRRRGGSSSIDNTPFARWKKALPSLPISKSIDSDDRKTISEVTKEPTTKAIKKKGGIFAKIVGLAIDKRTSGVPSETEQVPDNINDETCIDIQEAIPHRVLKVKDIKIIKNIESKKKVTVEFKTEEVNKELNKLCVELEKPEDRSDKKAVLEKFSLDKTKEDKIKSGSHKRNTKSTPNDKGGKEKRNSESNKLSKQTDSFGSAIPVITISTTESDEEATKSGVSRTEDEPKIMENHEEINKAKSHLKRNKNCSDLKSLRRQSSVDSINENKNPKEKDSENNGHKYQYSI